MPLALTSLLFIRIVRQENFVCSSPTAKRLSEELFYAEAHAMELFFLRSPLFIFIPAGKLVV